MADPREQPTCWTLIADAAAGNPADRSEFSLRYLDVVRAAFRARWRTAPLSGLVDDGVQEVFLECFRADGVLAKADPERPAGFRALLFGVVRNVALRAERQWLRARAHHAPGSIDEQELAAREDGLSKVFDRAWASSLIRQAGELMARRAREGGGARERRVELLRLRFQEGQPIRDIAARWGEKAQAVHETYRQARMEFRECLREVVAFHSPGDGSAIDEECRRLLEVLA